MNRSAFLDSLGFAVFAYGDKDGAGFDDDRAIGANGLDLKGAARTANARVQAVEVDDVAFADGVMKFEFAKFQGYHVPGAGVFAREYGCGFVDPSHHVAAEESLVDSEILD